MTDREKLIDALTGTKADFKIENDPSSHFSLPSEVTSVITLAQEDNPDDKLVLFCFDNAEKLIRLPFVQVDQNP